VGQFVLYGFFVAGFLQLLRRTERYGVVPIGRTRGHA
jgi:hypothetical protein